MDYFLVILVLIVCSIGFVYSLNYQAKEKMRKDSLGNLGVSPIEVKYIGGHPEFVNMEKGLLILNNSNLEFRGTPLGSIQLGSGDGYKIQLRDIDKISLETNESLTLTRMALVGIYALALKKKTNYVVVDWLNDIKETSTILFEVLNANNLQVFINNVSAARYREIKAKMQ